MLIVSYKLAANIIRNLTKIIMEKESMASQGHSAREIIQVFKTRKKARELIGKDS